MNRISIASDHAGFEYKSRIKTHLEANGYQVEDFGAWSTEPVDYPKYVRAAARAVADGNCSLGIIFGGSGNEAIVANRLKGIRCAVVWNTQTAQLSVEHGNCNMIAIGQRMMSEEDALAIVDAWLEAEFKSGRHQRRIDKIDGLLNVKHETDISELVAMNASLIIDEGHTYRLTAEELTDRFQTWLENGFEYQIFRDQDGSTVGYALWREQPDYIFLRQFFIKDAYRRKGLGTHHIKALLEGPWKGWTSIRLEVMDRNERAQAFWHSFGFGPYARTLELKNA